MSNIDRRALVAGIDPIFAAIEEHRVAQAAVIRACGEDPDHLGEFEDGEMVDRHCHLDALRGVVHALNFKDG